MTLRILVCTIICAVALADAGRGQTAGSQVPPRKKAPLQGTVFLSTGEKLFGRLSLTRGKKLRVYDDDKQEYRDTMLHQLAKLQIIVKRTRIEKEWRFKEEGSPEKVFTDRTYPRLDFIMILTFKDKKKKPLTCNIAKSMVLYLRDPDAKKDAQGRRKKPKRLFIQPHLKGEIGQKPSDLVHIKEIVFGPPKKKPKAEPEKQERDSKKTENKAGTKPKEQSASPSQGPPVTAPTGPEDQTQKQTHSSPTKE